MRPHNHISFSVNNLMGTYTLHCRDASLWSYLVSRISFHQLMGTNTHFVHRLAILSHTRHQIVTSFCFSRAPTPTHFRRLVSTPKPILQLIPARYQCPRLPTLASDPPTSRLSPPALKPKTHKCTVARCDDSISTPLCQTPPPRRTATAISRHHNR